MNKILINSILNKLAKTITGILLIILFFILAEWFLSKNEPVKANLLIVEGWLPPYALAMACNEFQNNKYDLIITTGVKYSAYDFCMVASNGYLIFYPQYTHTLWSDKGNHTIEVVAFSDLDGASCAHFNFYVNDLLVGDFSADKKERKYGINWKGNLEDIDSLMIQFDNDFWDDSGDRNLYVKEIIIDKNIRIPYQYYSELDLGNLDGKERITKYKYFDSSAEFCKDYMITCGIDSDFVIAVPNKKVLINRTLSSVITIRNWLKLANKDIRGINIISMGIHSRRTWISYKKVLGTSIEIGIISIPEDEKHKSLIKDAIKIIDEIIRISYYKLILTFYDN